MQKKLSRRGWTVLTLSLLLSCLLGIAGAVILIDPFEVYHKATRFIPRHRQVLRL